ncbi:MAG: hypothetical protein HY319_30045 [Armatimonadetes bacterium]|nr:hypothetical protein [Armatimonadota bacterium]
MQIASSAAQRTYAHVSAPKELFVQLLREEADRWERGEHRPRSGQLPLFVEPDPEQARYLRHRAAIIAASPGATTEEVHNIAFENRERVWARAGDLQNLGVASTVLPLIGYPLLCALTPLDYSGLVHVAATGLGLAGTVAANTVVTDKLFQPVDAWCDTMNAVRQVGIGDTVYFGDPELLDEAQRRLRPTQMSPLLSTE